MKLLWLTNFQRNKHGSNLRVSYELLKRIVTIDKNLEIDIMGYMPDPFNKTSKSKMTNLGNICSLGLGVLADYFMDSVLVFSTSKNIHMLFSVDDTIFQPS